MDVITGWLEDNFDNESTKTTYGSHLKSFSKFLEETKRVESIEEYIDNVSTEEFVEDFRSYVDWVKENDLASKTINNRLGTVKMFFSEHGIEFPEVEWRRMRRRKIPRDLALTHDRAGDKEEWRRILSNLSIEGRSLVIFLLSTGCRIGETLQLKKSDINLDSDPPSARIRGEYAKNDRPRTVYFTQEAAEEVQRWLEYRKRKGLRKKTRLSLSEQEKENLSEEEQKKRLQGLRKMRGKFSESERIWPIAKRTAYDIFARGLEKADLEERDERTNRRKIHFHSCRKFYKTHMRGMDEDVVEFLLGHQSGIRGIYRKYEESDIPERQYKENCGQLKVLEPEPGVDIERIREVEIDSLRTTLKTHGIPEAKVDGVTDSYFRRRTDRLRAEQEGLSLVRESPDLGALSEKEYEELKSELIALVEKQEPQQKVILQDDLQDYLDRGWKYLDSANNDKIVVEKTPGAKEVGERVTEREKTEGVSYYLLPAHDKGKLKEALDKGTYRLSGETRYRERFEVGDKVCFYVSGTGVVATGVIKSPANERIPEEGEEREFPLEIKDISWLEESVRISESVRGKLSAFADKDPSGNWSWFVLGPSRLTKEDYQVLTER